MSWIAVPAMLGVVALGAAAVPAVPVFAFEDDRISESSGLVDLGSTMVTTNDSGDEAQVYVVSSRSGKTLATTRYADKVEDVEALAPAGSDAVWVGDIGDNQRRRKTVQVYRVPVGASDQSVTATSYDLEYPDGAHDAESLIVGSDGRLRIITKSLLGGRVYVAPRTLSAERTNQLKAGPDVDIWATDAAVFPDGKHILVRGYGGALVATFPGFRTVAEFALPDQEQGEGVSIGKTGSIRLSSEGVNSEVLQVELPREVAEKMAASSDEPPSGLDDSGVVDSDRAEGIEWPWVIVASAGAVVGWFLVRRLRSRHR